MQGVFNYLNDENNQRHTYLNNGIFKLKTWLGRPTSRGASRRGENDVRYWYWKDGSFGIQYFFSFDRLAGTLSSNIFRCLFAECDIDFADNGIVSENREYKNCTN